MYTQHRVNQQIRAREVRVIGPKGENLGVLDLSDAIKKALEFNLDLVEISTESTPPVTKIVDYGKFLYSENKKQKNSKTKIKVVEIKNIQIKVGTGEHDLELKAKKASEWLREGHRVRINLFLPGRTKYMAEQFLQERMERVLKLIPIEYRADKTQKNPKGLTVLIEKVR